MDGDVTVPVDIDRIRQETGYWCGPATMQQLLWAAGINVTEREMADQLGTTDNGTNSIDLLTRELNERIPGKPYLWRAVPDPAPKKGVDLFRAELIATVDAGYGVGCNVDVSPGNYPRPTRGERLTYGGGRVLHYFAAMGYNRSRDEALIADSGFRDYLYWMSIPQLVTCIAAKGYTAAPNAEPRTLDPAAINDFIRVFAAPLISDVKDVREQFCGAGSRDAGQYAGWPQLGRDSIGRAHTLVDGFADLHRTLVGA